MDSINQEQPEKNREDLNGAKAIEKMRELVGKSETCFFCTEKRTAGSSGTRPMSVQEVDQAGNLWFLSAYDSHKNEELASDPSVALYFQGSAHSDFLVLYGKASLSRDKAKIDQLWEPVIKTWFTEGKDDPRITYYQGRAERRLLLGHQTRHGGSRGEDAGRRGHWQDP
jgi:general stress protein 26